MAGTWIVGVEEAADGVRAALVDLAPGPAAVLATAEVETSSASGSREASFREVLRQLMAAQPRAVQARAVTVVSTRCEDAFAAAKDLARVACVRLTGDAEDVIPALAGWPRSLLAAVGGHHHVLRGGNDVGGRQLGGPTEEELDALVRALADDHVEAVAVTGTFSSLDAGAESRVEAAISAALPRVVVSVSHRLGSLGLLEREGATALNAALLPVAARLTAELGAATEAALPGLVPYLTRVDGSLMELPFARRFPALTLGATTAALVRGAARLAGTTDALVLIGGAERPLLGVVQDGEPQLEPGGLEVAGLRTSLPRVALADVDVAESSWPTTVRALVGGDLPWVSLVPDLQLGAAPLADPEHAGAVGAAGATVAGLVDRVVPRGGSRDPVVISQARAEAVQRAVLAGALEPTVRVAAVEESPLAYVPGDLVRLTVRAAGDLP